MNNIVLRKLNSSNVGYWQEDDKHISICVFLTDIYTHQPMPMDKEIKSLFDECDKNASAIIENTKGNDTFITFIFSDKVHITFELYRD